MCIKFKTINRNRPLTISLEEILDAINKLEENLKRCKSLIPYMDASVLGYNTVRTAPFYISSGLDVTICYPRNLTKTDIDKNNEISKWINENFIVRLYSLLEYYGVLEFIDKNLLGFEHINIIRRLRQIYAHSPGKIDYSDKDHKKLLNRMKQCLNLTILEVKPEEFPLAINTVIIPLIDGCKKYVTEKFSIK